MIKGKFEYVLMGVFITLITLVGVFSFVLNQAQAKEEPLNRISVGELEKNVSAESNTENLNSGSSGIPTQRIDEAAVKANLEAFAERNHLVENWQQTISSQTGWLHMKILHDRELDGGGLLPNGVEIPQDYISELWYSLDGAQVGISMINIMWDLDGNLVQVATYQGGSWRNFSENGEPFFASQDNSLTTSGEPLGFPQDSRFVNDSINFNRITQESAVLDNQQTAVFTYQYQHPVMTFDEEGLEDIAISGGVIRETLDTVTGQTLTVATTHTLEDGSEQMADTYSYLLVEVIDDLPELAAKYLTNEVNDDAKTE